MNVSIKLNWRIGKNGDTLTFVLFLYSVFHSCSRQYQFLPIFLGPYPFDLLGICTSVYKALLIAFLQSSWRLPCPPADRQKVLEITTLRVVFPAPTPTCGKLLWHSLSARVSSVELSSRCPQCGLLAHLFWLPSLFLTSPFPYRCFLHFLNKLQLTLEQCRFELHGFTYMRLFFIYLCCSNPRCSRGSWCWEPTYAEGQLKWYVDFWPRRWPASLTLMLFRGQLYLHPVPWLASAFTGT